MKKLIGILLLVLITAMLLTACGGGGGGGEDNGPPAVTLVSITVAPSSARITTGVTQQFTATATYSDGSTKDLTNSATWSSSDGTRASVDSAGLATASTDAAGATTIAAASAGISGRATLRVIINLPKTGQVVSYDTNTIKRDDGALKMGVDWPGQRFTINSSPSGTTITDNLTGLMWLKDANCIQTRYPSFDADGTAGDGLVTWQHALDFVAEINKGTYPNCGGGYTDWRLPNRNELRSVVNLGEIGTTWLTNQGFQNVLGYDYWSSTHAFSTGGAWGNLIDSGGMYAYGAAANLYVWPVRAGQGVNAPARLPRTGQVVSYSTSTTSDDGALQAGVAWPSPRFTNPDGTTPITGDVVVDQLTGMMWPKNGVTPTSGACTGGSKTWQAALNYAACLNTNNYLGYNDWRVPNIHELAALIKADEADIATWLYNEGSFSVISGYYWSSTTLSYNTPLADVLDMSNGTVTGRTIEVSISNGKQNLQKQA